MTVLSGMKYIALGIVCVMVQMHEKPFGFGGVAPCGAVNRTHTAVCDQSVAGDLTTERENCQATDGS